MLLACLIAAMLSSCGSYAPQVRDVSEQPIDGNYWYQRFTLYDPANPSTDCPISRTGQKLDLNSHAELSDQWRKNCRSSTDYDNPSSSSN
jgi:hypothetical protein